MAVDLSLVPDLSVGPTFDQIPLNQDPLPYPDMQAQGRVGRLFVYPDDIPPTLALLAAPRGDAGPRELHCDKDGNLYVNVTDESTGSGGVGTFTTTLMNGVSSNAVTTTTRVNLPSVDSTYSLYYWTMAIFPPTGGSGSADYSVIEMTIQSGDFVPDCTIGYIVLRPNPVAGDILVSNSPAPVPVYPPLAMSRLGTTLPFSILFTWRAGAQPFGIRWIGFWGK